MMKLWKKGSLIMVSGLLAAALAGSAWAAEERTKISQITLTVESTIEAGNEDGDVSITVDSDNYRVDDVEIVNDDGEWSSGDEPRVQVTLEADEDYYFDTMSKSKVKLRGDDATYVTSSRKSNKSTMVITLRLDELEGTLEIEGVEWREENTPIAEWESADGAKSYQVRLYRESSSVGSAVTTTNDYYDFSSSITREGDYYFRVRAVNKSNKKGEWYESDSFYVNETMLNDIKNGRYAIGNGSGSTSSTPSSGTTEGTWKRNQVGWWYEYPNGSYPSNGWMAIKNVWYCFDASGYMRTGWIQAGDGKWYYCDPREGSGQGAMLTNTTTPDGYRVDANGVWIQ